jgi:hypothetical protein
LLPTLSLLSVRTGPENRLRHRCSSRYLRISPLHREFRSPLPASSQPVSTARPGLSPRISQRTRQAAYELFTPNNSGQRLRPTYYRGCWHVVSRRFFPRYRLDSLLVKGVYNPKAFIPHAASLRQASAHCAIFPTAASRRSLGRVSVPVWPVALSGRLPVVALVGRYPANKLIGREPLPGRKNFPPPTMRKEVNVRSYSVLIPVSRSYPEAKGRLLTCYSPVRRSSTPKGLSARLACVKHAASVRPEPGSNSPLMSIRNRTPGKTPQNGTTRQHGN